MIRLVAIIFAFLAVITLTISQPSLDGEKEENPKRKILSPEEKTAILNTWHLVAKDLQVNGVNFYIHFFTQFPEYQKLFRFADVPLDQLHKSEELKAFALVVMNAINRTVNNLDDNDALTKQLVQIGRNHKKRNLTVGDFQNFRKSFLSFLNEALGDEWTPTVEKSWRKLIRFMIKKIAKGLNTEG